MGLDAPFRGHLWEFMMKLTKFPGPGTGDDVLSGAATTGDHKFGGVRQRNFICSPFWRPETQNQGVSMVSSFWRLREGESLPLS